MRISRVSLFLVSQETPVHHTLTVMTPRCAPGESGHGDGIRNAYAIANAGAKGDKTLFATFDTFARICF